MSYGKTDILQFGIIGCGWFGRVHIERLSEIPNVVISAVCDPNREAAQALAAKVPPHAQSAAGVAVYTDYHELLRHEGLHAVSINSPNKWHVEQILAALEQNLHVLCEKPLTLIPEDVTKVVEATERAGKIVAISYQSRYRENSQLLRAALQSGTWGKITSVCIFYCENWLTPNIGTWRHDPARCPGGFFADANSHQLDLLFHLTNLQPHDVQATMETRGTAVPMVTWGQARLKTGQSAEEAGIPFTFQFVGDARHWREEINIITERAEFEMRNGQLFWTDGNGGLKPATPELLGLPAVMPSPDSPDKAFVAALRGGAPVLSPPETVWPVLNFTLAALQSAGQEILRR